MTDVRPCTVWPASHVPNTHTLIPTKTTNSMMPIRAIRRIGLTDSELMPLTESATIFASVYFVSPCSAGDGHRSLSRS